MIGGANKLRGMIDRFYDLLDQEHEFDGLRALHPHTLDNSREKTYKFLSGWSGGPNLYIEQYGHPMLRTRHLPYAIGISERDQWLRCMARAMHDIGLDETLQERLLASFSQTADWMCNKPE